MHERENFTRIKFCFALSIHIKQLYLQTEFYLTVIYYLFHFKGRLYEAV